ncbi:MAG: hypothetical protein K2Q09_03945 [Phycisphaerales bacterium]|nr:hypothetical protein [Phycisphaerales bacterium]
MARPISVIFFDDGPGLSEALEALLSRQPDLLYQGCFARTDDLVGALVAVGPAVLVVNHDLVRPGNTRALIEQVQRVAPRTRILMWFERHDAVAEGAREQLRAVPGVTGVIDRDGSSVQLLDAIRRAADPPRPLGPAPDREHRSPNGHGQALG